MATKSLLIVGCGDIGAGLAGHFLGEGWRVMGLRRHAENLPAGVEPLQADISSAESVVKLGKLRADYVVMTLTPQNYRPEGYEAIFEQGLDHILNALEPPKLLLFVSSTGVYDQHDHSWINEDSPTLPNRFSGKSLLAAEQRIAQTGWPSSIIRFGGIYGPGRLQMINKVLEGECAPPEPLHYTNRIHRDDCVGFIVHLLALANAGHRLESCYLGVDDEPASIQDVQRWLAELLRVTYRADGEVVKRTGSKRCSNRRLRDSGYELKYPTYREGFLSVISDRREH
ncbi:SDR family oxidoreductase [Spongiibacter taiwanensis]|uniref:SDR family oxidoreductase n=1 Tax=Spongiibacter taiwanensis TaxID=1748242 RepID=UPI002035A404|nr:SDR family oxidoreductase [Spongiibacter taiwanensis]USA41628.1 SDR family oxidoreductase [Spongiibacter taiwanensis]